MPNRNIVVAITLIVLLIVFVCVSSKPIFRSTATDSITPIGTWSVTTIECNDFAARQNFNYWGFTIPEVKTNPFLRTCWASHNRTTKTPFRSIEYGNNNTNPTKTGGWDTSVVDGPNTCMYTASDNNYPFWGFSIDPTNRSGSCWASRKKTSRSHRIIGDNTPPNDDYTL